MMGAKRIQMIHGFILRHGTVHFTNGKKHTYIMYDVGIKDEGIDTNNYLYIWDEIVTVFIIPAK